MKDYSINFLGQKLTYASWGPIPETADDGSLSPIIPEAEAYRLTYVPAADGLYLISQTASDTERRVHFAEYPATHEDFCPALEQGIPPIRVLLFVKLKKCFLI